MFPMNTMPIQYSFHPNFDPCEYPGVQAITYDGLPIGKQKTKLFAYIGFPENTGEAVPGVVLIHGGGGHAYAQWVAQWVNRGYAAIAMDYTGHFPDPLSETGWRHGLYGEFSQEGYVSVINNTGMVDGVDPNEENHWMYHAVASASIARKILAADPRVDEPQIGVVGVSWGSVITTLLIEQDSAFAFAVPVYGSGYLGPEVTLGSIADHFTHPSVRERYLAEKGFSQVQIPVLWLCWNDDNNFSIQANSRSYLDTVKNNGQTRLSIVHDMFHSHRDAWKRPEPFTFADAMLKRSTASLPRLLSQPEGRNFAMELMWDQGFTATVYYITSPMKYCVHNKFGRGAHPYMEQQWKTMPCRVQGTSISAQLPEDAAGYYVEIKTQVGGEEFIISSVYHDIFRS